MTLLERRRQAVAGAAAAMVLALASACTGCATTYSVVSYDDSPAGKVTHKTIHSFLWGTVRGSVPYDGCGVPGDVHGNGLWRVGFAISPWQTVASALTLGIWTPMSVSVECAVPRPRHKGIGGPACNDPGAQPAGATACAPATAVTPVEESASRGIRDPAYEPECEKDVTWHNVSQEVTAKPRVFCRPKPGRGLTVDQRAAPLAALIRWAEQDAMRIRAVGSGWSFSRAAPTEGMMVDMRWFGASLPLPRTGDWAPGTAGRSFAHFEAGATVDAVNLALQNKGYSLLTMGGSAGQTWLGATSTGTHGGDTGYRAIADYLQALAIVTEGGKLVWIERKSQPLTRGGYAAEIGAELVQDDELFDAAMTGLGSLGIVVSAIIEVQPLKSYMLFRQPMPYDAKLQKAMETLDFTGWSWPDPRQNAFAAKHVHQHRSDTESALRHFEVVVNPYATGPGNQGALVTTVWDNNHFTVPPTTDGTALNVKTRIGTAVVRMLESKQGSAVPEVLDALLPTEYPPITTPLEGPLRSLFPKGTPTGGLPLSMEIALARADVNRAMSVILAQINAHPGGYYFPGVVAFRFSRGTEALLGFSSFTDTVTIEFPTVAGVTGTPEFFGRVHQALEQAHLAHTQHLGQWNTYQDDPSGMAAFGDRVARFCKARERLLTTARARFVFSNDYTDRIGITAPYKTPPAAGSIQRQLERDADARRELPFPQRGQLEVNVEATQRE